MTYAPSVDPVAFTEAIMALRENLGTIQNQDDREIGELQLEQLERAIHSGETGITQFQRFSGWLSTQVKGTGELVTGGAILWNLASVVGQAIGHPLPPITVGLGQ